MLIWSNLVYLVHRCNKNRGVAETAPLIKLTDFGAFQRMTSLLKGSIPQVLVKLGEKV